MGLASRARIAAPESSTQSAVANAHPNPGSVTLLVLHFASSQVAASTAGELLVFYA